MAHVRGDARCRRVYRSDYQRNAGRGNSWSQIGRPHRYIAGNPPPKTGRACVGTDGGGDCPLTKREGRLIGPTPPRRQEAPQNTPFRYTARYVGLRQKLPVRLREAADQERAGNRLPLIPLAVIFRVATRWGRRTLLRQCPNAYRSRSSISFSLSSDGRVLRQGEVQHRLSHVSDPHRQYRRIGVASPSL